MKARRSLRGLSARSPCGGRGRDIIEVTVSVLEASVEKLEDKLFTISNKWDEGHPHVSIADQATCAGCPGKYCIHFCPGGVYIWDGETQRLTASYENCIECGACSYGCPYDNIICSSPRGGYGVQYRYG